MKPRSQIYIMGILMAAMIAGCSDNPGTHSNEHHSNEHHSNPHDAAQHPEPKSEPKINPASDNTPMTRSADVHSHGDAELAVVLEKGIITIEFGSPLYNILGFEHAPETPAQTMALKQAEQQLGRGAGLFAFNPQAKCVPLSKAMTVTLFPADTDEADHDDHDATETHDEDTHKDVFLAYEFKCQNPAKLSNVTINLFEFFKELAKIDVTFLGPATQMQVTLNRHQRQLDITP